MLQSLTANFWNPFSDWESPSNELDQLSIEVKDSIDQSWPGQERSNNPRRFDSEYESGNGRSGVELSTRSLGSPKPNTQSASSTTSNASGHGESECEQKMVGLCSFAPSALKSLYANVSL